MIREIARESPRFARLRGGIGRARASAIVRPLLALLAVFAVACGSSTAEPDTQAEPASDTPPNAHRAGTPSTDDGAGSSSTATSDSAEVRFVLRNHASHDVYVVRDAQWMPLWLEIDGGLQLTGYGLSFCGSSDPSDGSNHNDPYFALEKIAAGSSREWGRAWQPYSVSLDGSCWKADAISAGKHSARVCVYDELADVSPSTATFPAGQSSAAVPASEWFESGPSRCVDIEIDVPATGTKEIAIDL